MSPSYLPVKLKIHCYSINAIYSFKIKIFSHVIKFLILSFVMTV
jgi:hypothetical protein